MVADAKECGEGVSFFGVRRLILADVPTASEDLMQRVGRAVRFMGHTALPECERNVEVRVYVATHRAGRTADEVLGVRESHLLRDKEALDSRLAAARAEIAELTQLELPDQATPIRVVLTTAVISNSPRHSNE